MNTATNTACAIRPTAAARARCPRSPKPNAAQTSSGTGSGSTGGGPGIAVDNFTVQDGTLVYRDLQRGREETIGDINARIAAASLQGPVESDGSLIFGGRRLGYSLNVAEIVQGRTVPLVFNLDLGHGTIVKVDVLISFTEDEEPDDDFSF